MAKSSRAVYTRTDDSRLFRLQYTIDAFLDHLLATGLVNGKPIAYIQWAHGNYDYLLKRPRVTPFNTNLTELFYRAEWESDVPQTLES